MNKRFEYTFFQYFKQFERMINLKPLNLGGVAGSGGGAGGPPGGFVGTLPQTRVAYDYSEAASSGVPASGLSLLDNLNHIRYRITVLESSGPGGPGSVTIEENNVIVASGVTIINFEGGVDVTNNGGGQVTVTVSGTTASGLPSLSANRVVITDNTGAITTNSLINVGPYGYNASYPSVVIGADNGYTDIDPYFILNLVSDDSEQPLLLNLQALQYQPALEFRYSNGTFASPSPSLAGDSMGEINFYSNGGTASADGTFVGGIEVLATQNHSTSIFGAQMNFRVVPTNAQFAVTSLALYGDTAEFIGDVEIPAANGYYLGDRATNNSWRIIASGIYLTFQKRESGVWNVKNIVPFTTGSGVAVTNLDDLNDVVITSPTNGQVLGYSGGIWRNVAQGSSGSGSGGSDPFWYIDGDLATLSGVGPAFVIPRDSTLQAVYVHAKDLGTSGATVIDINKNGTSIFTSNPSLPYNDPDKWVKSTPTVTFAEGDVLTLDIDAVASGASSLTVLAAMTSSGTTTTTSSGTGGITHLRLANDLISTNQGTPQAIGDLSFSALAGKTYWVKFIGVIHAEGNASVGGAEVTLAMSDSHITNHIIQVTKVNSTPTTTIDYLTSASAVSSISMLNSVNAFNWGVSFDGYITVDADRTISVRFSQATASSLDSSTLYKGASLQYQQIN